VIPGADPEVLGPRGAEIVGLGLELLQNPDLERLQEKLLESLAALCDAQSGALWLSGDAERGGDPTVALRLKAYRGLLDRQFLRERLDPQGPLGPRLREGEPWITGAPPAQSLFVPLVAAGEILGLVQLADPLAGELRADAVGSARLLATFSSFALRTGRKLAALQRLGLRDRDTAAYNLSYFTDYAGKEIYKARRYGRTFSLMIFSIDNLAQVKVRLGATEARQATRGIIRALTRMIRDSDVIAKASDSEFYVLLPETDYFGASMFMRRAHAAVREEADAEEVDAQLPLGLVAGASTFPKDGEDFDELIHRCRRRTEERRASLQRRLLLDGLPFWGEIDLLLGNPQSPRLPAAAPAAEPSRRGQVSEGLFDELQAEIARELLRDTSARGLLYIGLPEIRADLPVVTTLEAAGGAPTELAARAYLLGRRGDLASHPTLTPLFLEGDERLARHELILWLSEHSAYALVQRRGRGAAWGFHTSDTAVVEGLVSKLQAEYDLQPY
jgi:two-component system cell cycle response regulator